MNREMISVCIATFNGGKYIREQIMSVLPQLNEKDEIIISDDGSTDDTIYILESLHDQRIKIYVNEREHGFIWNFENALMKSSGDIIFLCDQDDVWKADKVEVTLKALNDHDIVLHDAEIINKEGVRTGIVYSASLHKREGFWSNLWKTRWLGCCMAFRRKVLEYALPFPRHIVGHDGWISAVGLVRFNYYYIPDVLMWYRRHGDNASTASGKSDHSWYYKLIQKRLCMIIEIGRRLLQKEK
jgi:glycosyltransferase involved in cell wall biosynthesis